ncbi:MAG TPA: polyphosphate kinase 2 family protein [Xanthobacteraceae bacterium]|jgi:PPK2 family polyphosphate:nucleotide phosphotransferase|nr:polyphosphate kinase 2 family protein [Xanthobacteraceae bacterium]
MKLDKIIKHCRIDKSAHFKLTDHDPAETFGLSTDIEKVEPLLAKGIVLIEDLQQRLYADGKWALLIVLQGMDAAGKDGVIKHVMSGINPQGCAVHSFKAPTAEELAHDFLWRIGKALPERGHIGIFNRSHYEDVLIVRVHPDMLKAQNLPPNTIGKDIWKHRFKAIRAFEQHLVRSGTVILKFHLRISKEEQLKRFLARLDEPGKRWKFSTGDVAERKRWDDYMAAYEDMIRETSTDEAPWYVVPADHKHIAWTVVSKAIIDALDGLRLEYPKVTGKALKELKKVERALKSKGA